MNKKLKADLVLVAAVFTIAAAAGLFMLLSRTEGTYAVVYVNGEERARYILSEDTTFNFVTPDGASYNTVEIKDGFVRVTEALCPDKVCVRNRAIGYSGQRIVCLPNRLVITIEGGENAPADIG